MLSMNRLPERTRVLIIRCLVEGMSIRATSRTAGVSKNTVLKLLREAGKACAEFQDRKLRDLTCSRVEVDEVWSFVYAKEKNVPRAKTPPPEAGDVWTWTAFDPDTKLVPSWRVGDRTSMTAIDFMDDLRARLAHRVQLTSDGHKPYLEAVEGAFGGDVDYAMLVKIYGKRPEGSKADTCIGAIKRPIEGRPNRKLISTSGVERNNLTMRMSMRRFGRLTNAFSKRVENHVAAISLHFMYYNFCRIHRTIETTPAMAAGVTDRLYEISDIVRIIEDSLPKPGPRGSYKKRENSNSN